jgi:hypothetical protein
MNLQQVLPKNWALFYQARIRARTPYGIYNDAYYLTPAEYGETTVAEINTAVQERIDNWIAGQVIPPVIIEPTEEELVAQINEGMKNQIEPLVERLMMKLPTKERVSPLVEQLTAYVSRLNEAK